ncbi:hypothetical protein DES49_0131 [Halospina denitrificans]|uniref:Metal-binding protein n=1 Tax=Halospina denitrificans TaxID=332522 RepID=A0A4R7JZQ3_9GAMM|nr:DUF411 domain-containing protein [Halospina denitrificans]TDT44032.1 hypothetical protein DES49_0131 [Halospina denitrificans]
MRRNLIIGSSLLILAVIAGGFWAWGPAQQQVAQDNTAQAPIERTLVVYASPQCGCCGDWVTHMENNGFTTEMHRVNNINEIKKEAGLPRELASCHTAFIDDYLIEGHVPAKDVRRLLREQPEASGLSVPRMPMGSPGMEIEGRGRDAFDVILFKQNGTQSIYQSYSAQTSL